MNRNLKNLLSDGSIESFHSNTNQIKGKLNISNRDLKAAKKIVELNDPDTDDSAYRNAYNAMLQAGYALMYRKGYRPKDRSKAHFTVVEFTKIEYSSGIPLDVILAFENARQQRNTLQYESAGILQTLM